MFSVAGERVFPTTVKKSVIVSNTILDGCVPEQHCVLYDGDVHDKMHDHKKCRRNFSNSNLNRIRLRSSCFVEWFTLLPTKRIINIIIVGAFLNEMAPTETVSKRKLDDATVKWTPWAVVSVEFIDTAGYMLNCSFTINNIILLARKDTVRKQFLQFFVH